jgi:hypothetical protein
MAKQILERILDDLDGSEGAASIEFGLDGVMYTIDLTDKHQDELRSTLEPFLASARRERRLAAGRSAVRRPAAGTGDRDRNQAIRGWALENGIELATRGRIAQGVLDAFDSSDVDALYAAVGIERAPEAPKRGRRKAAGLEFSEPTS